MPMTSCLKQDTNLYVEPDLDFHSERYTGGDWKEVIKPATALKLFLGSQTVSASYFILYVFPYFLIFHSTH